MDARSQAPWFESSGRVKQKRRTRNALVDAARALIERGETPTVADAAEEAEVSRTTAYRYFPTQESLLLELNVTMSVESIEELLLQPDDGSDPAGRLTELIELFMRYVADNEALNRTALRHYMDTWLAVEKAGPPHTQPLREGRRRQWIETALGTVDDALPPAERDRLHAAVSLVIGVEAFTVMRDVNRLDTDAAIDVTQWAVRALVDAALRDATG